MKKKTPRFLTATAKFFSKAVKKVGTTLRKGFTTIPKILKWRIKPGLLARKKTKR